MNLDTFENESRVTITHMKIHKTLFVACLALASTAVSASPDGNGFGSARLSGGQPEFIGCLNSPDCSDRFFSFFNQATLEQGFTMQGASPLTSSVVNRKEGWVVGGLLHTFPFGPPRENLAGKEENTQFSPVLPKLLAGRLWTSGDTHTAIGMTALPPIPIQGAAALILGLDGSMAWDLGDGPHRWGLEADFTFVRATAPVAASKDQFENKDELPEGHLEEDLYMSNCDPDKGCIDVFSVVDLALRSRIAWQLGDTFFPYAAAGIIVVNQSLHVEYDDSKWKLFAIQPTLHGGAAWAPVEPLLLNLGLDLGFKQANQSDKGIGAFYRIAGAAGYRF